MVYILFELKCHAWKEEQILRKQNARHARLWRRGRRKLINNQGIEGLQTHAQRKSMLLCGSTECTEQSYFLLRRMLQIDSVECRRGAYSPFFVFVRHEELVELLSPEVLLVIVVLVNSIRVGYRVILVGQELFERQHWWLCLHIAVVLSVGPGGSAVKGG